MAGTGLSDLSAYKLDKVPPTVYYVPDFLTENEEEYILREVYNAPKPKWTELSHRRLQNWGGVPHEKGMIPETIPKWLETYCERVSSCGLFGTNKPNHILVNEYLPGQGIMPHTDGPMYHSVVANITCGSHGVLDLYNPILGSQIGTTGITDTGQESTSEEDRHFASVFLERRSLLLVTDDMYSNYLHGIKEQTEDQVTEKTANVHLCPGRNHGDVCQRETRVSLTIRNVPKVLKNKFIFGKKR